MQALRLSFTVVSLVLALLSRTFRIKRDIIVFNHEVINNTLTLDFYKECTGILLAGYRTRSVLISGSRQNTGYQNTRISDGYTARSFIELAFSSETR